MHPRIRELAKEAGRTGLPYGEIELEKFAELIVRACADVLHQDAAFMPELGVYAHDMVVNMGFKYE
jgi:hypothetical protein